jgi:hypothetical protein
VGQVDKLFARDDTKGATELRLCLRSRDKTKSDHRGRKHAQTTTGEPGMNSFFPPQRSEQSSINRCRATI